MWILGGEMKLNLVIFMLVLFIIGCSNNNKSQYFASRLENNNKFPICIRGTDIWYPQLSTSATNSNTSSKEKSIIFDDREEQFIFYVKPGQIIHIETMKIKTSVDDFTAYIPYLDCSGLTNPEFDSLYPILAEIYYYTSREIDTNEFQKKLEEDYPYWRENGGIKVLNYQRLVY